MVKKVIIVFLLILFFKSGIAQEEKDLWWFQTSENKKYEMSYQNAFCDISEGILKELITEYISKYVTSPYKKKKEIAIIVSSLFSEKHDEKKYRIRYMSNYHSFITYYSVNQIAEINGKVIFIQNNNANDFRIKKDILFGLLRDTFPDITKKNNFSYSKDGTFTTNFILEHEIPNYVLTIKNNKLIDKKLTFE